MDNLSEIRDTHLLTDMIASTVYWVIGNNPGKYSSLALCKGNRSHSTYQMFIEVHSG